MGARTDGSLGKHRFNTQASSHAILAQTDNLWADVMREGMADEMIVSRVRSKGYMLEIGRQTFSKSRDYKMSTSRSLLHELKRCMQR